MKTLSITSFGDVKTSINSLKINLEPLLKDRKDEVNNFFDVTVKKYFETQGSRISTLKTILHRAHPVYFFDIYHPTSLRFKGDLQESGTVEQLFRKRNFIAVIGEAGSGKSMLAKYIFLTAINEADRIPVIVELRYLDADNKDLFQYISHILERKLSQGRNILETLLKNGKFLIILDGFDEMSGASSVKITDSINKFVEDFPHNYYLLLSRPYANAELLPGFSNYTINPLSFQEIETFIKKQSMDSELAENAIQSIKEQQSDVLTSFLQNPLLLSLYLLTYQGNSNIPAKKSIFYRRVIDALFKEHDSSTKFGFERSLKSKLSQENIEALLQSFSFASYCDGKFSFTRDYVNYLLLKIKDTLNIPDFSVASLVDDLKTGISLWLEEGNSFYFTHRSLQEYFAVMYLRRIRIRKENIYEIIQKNICSKGAVNETRNFLLLLKEGEEYDYVKYLLLPNLQLIRSKLTDNAIPSAPIALFLSKITVYENIRSVKFILSRASKPYAFIFDIIDFNIIKAFEGFLLSVEIQDYFINKIIKAKMEARDDMMSKEPKTNEFIFDIQSEESFILLTKFSATDEGEQSIASFYETLNREIENAQQFIKEYEQEESLAIEMLLNKLSPPNSNNSSPKS